MLQYVTAETLTLRKSITSQLRGQTGDLGGACIFAVTPEGMGRHHGGRTMCEASMIGLPSESAIIHAICTI